MRNKQNSVHRRDYLSRRLTYANALGVTEHELDNVIKRMYQDEKMSSYEIADILCQRTGKKIDARSVLRWMSALGATRPRADAYRLAASRGRIKWAYKDPILKFARKTIAQKLRYTVLERDGFACVLCGKTAKDDLLEVDHIVAVCKGGKTEMENLQTLCHTCNVGKRIVEKEV